MRLGAIPHHASTPTLTAANAWVGNPTLGTHTIGQAHDCPTTLPTSQQAAYVLCGAPAVDKNPSLQRFTDALAHVQV